MCGIAGIITPAPEQENRELVKKMITAMEHRGPDDRGLWISPDKKSILGSCRLSILDLSPAGHQPMESPDGRLVLTYNGEIYNYRELREDLKSQGFQFRSDSDTEVVLRAWEKWGPDSLARFNGMFSLFVLNKQTQQGFLVRDRLGIKPCFYHQDRERFIFASEAKAFYCLPNRVWDPRENQESLKSLLAFQFLSSPQDTLFSNLSRVPPGHYLNYDLNNGTTKLIRYYRINPAPEISRDHDEAIKAGRALLESSVSLRLRADVPVGVLLSGGLDSSLIAALAARNHPEKIRTFTAGFNHHLDERSYARKVAKHIGSDHHEVILDPKELNQRIEEVIPVFDALTSLDAGIFMIYFILEKLKDFKLKVLLVGEGADEVFGGYSWFRLSRPPLNLLPLSGRAKLHHYAISRMISRADESRARMQDQIREGEEKDIFRQISRWEMEIQLPSNYLMKVDHASMAHSTEARVPYLDHRLVEFAFALPASWKFKGSAFSPGGEKAFLREMAGGLLPAQIATRPKLGFPLSMSEVLKSNHDKVMDYLLSSPSFARENFTTSSLEKLANFRPRMYSPLEKQKEFLLWKLFLIEVWRRYVKSACRGND